MSAEASNGDAADSKSKRPLRLLIPYQASDERKKHDAVMIAANLERAGNSAILIDAEEIQFCDDERGTHVICDGRRYLLTEIDGAALRTPIEVKNTKIVDDALRRARAPVYQDYASLLAGADKLLSQQRFEAIGAPTPRTFGYAHDVQPNPTEIMRFLKSLGDGPYVIKAARGWSAKQVRIVDTAEEALAAFGAFHADSMQSREGGALIQEFVETGLPRRSIVRIQTLVGPDQHGALQARTVAAITVLAPAGQRITNVSLEGRRMRVALGVAEAREFHVAHRGMPEWEFERKLDGGEIEILDRELRSVAEIAAVAFGPGSLGVDVVRDHRTGKVLVLEVNPFSGGTRAFEEIFGFSIFEPWADSIESFVRFRRFEMARRES